MYDADTTARVAALVSADRDVHKARNEQMVAAFEATCADCCTSLELVRKVAIDSSPPSAQRILVVDDDLFTCNATKRILSTMDCEPTVDVSVSVRIALQMMRERRYQVIVVDWQLANGQAKDIVNAAGPLTWVILMSARLTPYSGGKMAASIGAHDWLPKPFEAHNLKYMVGKGLGNSEDPRGPAPPASTTAAYKAMDFPNKVAK